MTNLRLRVAIASTGRFHVLDLARELAALGHEVRFYSYVPRKRAFQFGLPSDCHVGLLPFVAPLVMLGRLAPRLAPRLRERLIHDILDFITARLLRPCDVFIGMSGLYGATAARARTRYKAKIYLERGSRHVLSQRELLSGQPGAVASDYIIRRELAGYRFADRIVVPSRHVAESFGRDPELAGKLFVNPYGVDLAMFPQREHAPHSEPKSVLFVGGWTYRKGADVLTEAIRSLNGVQVVHVGPPGDIPFPQDTEFHQIGSVPQHELAAHYAKAHVFAMASREEGLALVQVQALATGLPIVCTDRTGGADLGHTPALEQRITVVPHGDASALREALKEALATAGTIADLSPDDRASLSWRAYARRYSAELTGHSVDSPINNDGAN